MAEQEVLAGQEVLSEQEVLAGQRPKRRAFRRHSKLWKNRNFRWIYEQLCG